MSRREFTVALQIAIVTRASDSSWRIHCEKCGKWCPKRKDYEIDHVIPEAMRPDADKARKLVAADGQLLCIDCHDQKTDDDKGYIGEAKRREANDLGVKKRKKRWPSRKREREPYRPAPGMPRIAREYGL